MSSIVPNLMQLVWIAVALLVGGIQIVAAVLFLPHRGAGPWMMLGGACLALLTSIGQQFLSFIGNARNLWGDTGRIPLHTILTGLYLAGSLFHVVFAVGLLITAVRLRGISRHVGELEQIIGSGNPR